MRPDDELMDLIDRRRRAVRDLPGWRSGPERLLTLLQRATRLRAIDGMDAAPGDNGGRASGGVWDSVSGVLLYPRRPANAARLQLIDDLTSREAIMVAWYDEADWTTTLPKDTSPTS